MVGEQSKTRFDPSRRELLQAAGVGLFGLVGASVADRTAGHETYRADAPDRLRATLIPSDGDAGFNYPYFLYAPETVVDEPRPILVEPVNSGETTDDFTEQLSSAEALIRGRNGFSRAMSEGLRTPLVVPVLPRPQSEPVDWTHYVHALDTETMRIDSGELARVDEQVLRMVEHARELLGALSYPVSEEIILNGVSASGNFVNRFAALHPEDVRSVSAGAVNGTAILPIEEAKGHTLNYQIGIADLAELTGEPFDLEAWREVDQLIYMGAEDENDTIPYGDAWSDEQREIALDVYGEDMQDDRMPYCESVYESVGASARFEVYEGVGHGPTAEVQEGIVAFHRRNMAVSRLTFAEPPAVGDTGLRVTGTVYDGDADAFEIRAFSDDRGELTAAPVRIDAEASVDTDVSLNEELVATETVTVAALEPGVTDPQRAVASRETTLSGTALRFTESPVVGGAKVTAEYRVAADYESETPPHLYLSTGGGERTLLTTVRPGERGVRSFDVDESTPGIPFEAGARVRLVLDGMGSSGQLAAAETAVGDGAGDSESASVTFVDHPTHEETAVTVEYALDEGYEPDDVVALRVQRDDRTPVLLDFVEPGRTDTETFALDKLPLQASESLSVSLSDGETLAREDVTVLVREPDAEAGETEAADVDPSFAYEPSNPSAGGTLAFDASDSISPNGEILSYTWSFGDGATAAGREVEHAFDAAGEYAVALDLVDDAGETARTERRVVVDGSSSSGDSAASDSEGDGNSDGTATTGDSVGPQADDRSTDNDGSGETDGTPEARLGEIEPAFTHRPSDPAAGDDVAFSASGTRSPNGDVLSYAWAFGDDDTGAGELVAHSFASPGEYDVTLEVVDAAGVSARADEQVTVREAETDASTAEPGPESAAVDDEPADADVQQTSADGAGFGVAGGIAALGGVAHLLKRRLTDEEDR